MEQVQYPSDCIRIQKIAVGLGYLCTLKQAEALWEAHSASMAAGWLFTDSEYEIEGAVRRYFEENT